MESGEHTIVGDASPPPGLSPANLEIQGIWTTYGHVVALGGDFYGVPDSPISLGTSGADRAARFSNAVKSLRSPDDGALGPVTLAALIGLIDEEVAALAPAIANPTPTGASDIYKSTGGMGNTWPTLYTQGSYVELAASNFDHFGLHAQVAYITGHRIAIQLAVAAHNKTGPMPGMTVTLADAYIANAFADHYLTDLFSAGHLRTPRLDLHNWSDLQTPLGGLGDVLSWYGHDEDCRYGLNVTNGSDTWLMYGDKRIFDSVNAHGLGVAKEAARLSKQEVYDAYVSGVDPFAAIPIDAPPSQVPSKALRMAPDPLRAVDWSTNPNHRILFYFFQGSLQERKNINDMTDHEYVTCYTSLGTWGDLKANYTLLS